MRSLLKARARSWLGPSMSATRNRYSWVSAVLLHESARLPGKDFPVLEEQHLVDAAAHVLGNDLHLLLDAVELPARQGRHDGHLRRRLDAGGFNIRRGLLAQRGDGRLCGFGTLDDPGHDFGAVEPLEEPGDGIERRFAIEAVVDVPADHLVAALAGVVVARGRPEDPALAVSEGQEGKKLPAVLHPVPADGAVVHPATASRPSAEMLITVAAPGIARCQIFFPFLSNRYRYHQVPSTTL